ncbi:MAG: glycine cleavage system protein GcvH [Propionibacteriales bacterium]|nr:glycine cleavage system protein GcvH [Propionibacteriales bacterium]
MSDFPEDLKYSAEHEWVRGGSGSTVRVGVTDYAVEQLSDIIYVSLPEVGDELTAGEACGELESTKSVSDIFSPISGVVTAINGTLADAPQNLNTDPYGDGWLFEVEISSGSDLDDLLDAVAYAELTD